MGLDPHKVVFAVPSGNFGNLTSALIGKRMGMPVKRFIAANNRNDIFYQYLRSGVYSPKASIPTIANAMDVGDPSNFARILDLYDGSRDRIAQDISGVTYSDDQIGETIRAVYERTGYLLDPHGATGYRALEEELAPGEVGIALETAHPAKFKSTVEEIIGKDVEVPAKLAAFIGGTKHTVKLSPTLACFKKYLMGL